MRARGAFGRFASGSFGRFAPGAFAGFADFAVVRRLFGRFLGGAFFFRFALRFAFRFQPRRFFGRALSAFVVPRFQGRPGRDSGALARRRR
ncbi:MAG TPA: hypothetical protein VG188_07755 [Solirubrobacteraceae bacterium]|nr:hypothetical protein [Solirubrobacteraceae bacterium]